MLVYVLMERCTRTEWHNVINVYATWEAAEAAAERYCFPGCVSKDRYYIIETEVLT